PGRPTPRLNCFTTGTRAGPTRPGSGGTAAPGPKPVAQRLIRRDDFGGPAPPFAPELATLNLAEPWEQGATTRRTVMALLGREFIAVPDDRKQQIVFKWPDHNIRKYTRAIVNADELAMFVNTGQVVATMGPGRHQIDADEIPGLGAVIDWATGG